MIEIREERAGDRDAVWAVNRAAFGRDGEADLVDALRESGEFLVSLVACDGDEIVGHVLFSPVSVGEREPGRQTMGLAPLAVTPARQRQGIGGMLVRAGIEACRSAGCRLLIVLGHPWYYPKFGFLPASRLGIRYRDELPDEVFMALPLTDDPQPGYQGVVRFHAAFDRV